MSRIVLVENEYITLEHLPDKKMIYHTIHKPIPSQPLRDALNIGTEAIKEHGATKWLSDDRKNGPLAPEDAEWGFHDWNPRTIKAGWKYWANVVPTDVVSAGALTPVINDLYKLGLRMMVFDNLEEALDWLEKVDHVE
jgi:hypothetical protein